MLTRDLFAVANSRTYCAVVLNGLTDMSRFRRGGWFCYCFVASSLSLLLAKNYHNITRFGKVDEKIKRCNILTHNVAKKRTHTIYRWTLVVVENTLACMLVICCAISSLSLLFVTF